MKPPYNNPCKEIILDQEKDDEVGANNAPTSQYRIIKIQGKEWIADGIGLPLYPVDSLNEDLT